MHYILAVHKGKEGPWVLIKGVKLCDTYSEGRWQFVCDGPTRARASSRYLRCARRWGCSSLTKRADAWLGGAVGSTGGDCRSPTHLSRSVQCRGILVGGAWARAAENCTRPSTSTLSLTAERLRRSWDSLRPVALAPQIGKREQISSRNMSCFIQPTSLRALMVPPARNARDLGEILGGAGCSGSL